MKDRKLSEVIERFKWLIEVIQDKHTKQAYDSEKIKDMRAFCDLVIQDRFFKVSYNSLKQRCHDFQLPVEITANEPAWERLVALRSKAFQKLNESKPIPDEDPSQQASELEKHIHLCETAYMSLYVKIKDIVENERDVGEIASFKLSQALAQSRAMYASLFSTPRRVQSDIKLVVVTGGKTN